LQDKKLIEFVCGLFKKFLIKVGFEFQLTADTLRTITPYGPAAYYFRRKAMKQLFCLLALFALFLGLANARIAEVNALTSCVIPDPATSTRILR
jgi:hypothetical protein